MPRVCPGCEGKLSWTETNKHGYHLICATCDEMWRINEQLLPIS